MEITFDRAIYHAPRGKRRLMYLGSVVAQRYLSPSDRLIGVIGDAGAGKSLLVRGMFPGLVLTNDDDGIYSRPAPVMEDARRGKFDSHTYHVDARLECAFAQPWQVGEAIRAAVTAGKRVVVEHFELVYPAIGSNAELLIGIGDEVLVTRPWVFGPYPQEIAKVVYQSLKYRKMAHSAEDLTAIAFMDFGYRLPEFHSDVWKGYVIEFRDRPEIDLDVIEARVREYISQDIPICQVDEEHIRMGNRVISCSGPRIHVSSTGQIKGFRMEKEIKYDRLADHYLLAGLVGEEEDESSGASQWPQI